MNITTPKVIFWVLIIVLFSTLFFVRGTLSSWLISFFFVLVFWWIAWGRRG